MTSTTDLARLGAMTAADLEQKGYRGAGIVRALARAVIDLPEAADDDGCSGCGAELPQPPSGGKRLWCSEQCRRRHRR